MTGHGKPLLRNPERVRLAVAADMLHVPFPGLFRAMCLCGLDGLIDDFLTVPVVLVDELLAGLAVRAA